MLNKYFISTDLHGRVGSLLRSLSEANFNIDNKDHILVLNGDLFDYSGNIRSSGELVEQVKGDYDPVALLDLVYSMAKDNKVILIKGNHDKYLYDNIPYLDDHRNKQLQASARGMGTLMAYKRMKRKSVIDKFKDLYENHMVDSVTIKTNDNTYVISHSGNPQDCWEPLQVFNPPQTECVYVLGHMEIQTLLWGNTPDGYVECWKTGRIAPSLERIKRDDENRKYSHRGQITFDQRGGLLYIKHKGKLSYIAIDNGIHNWDQTVLILEGECK